MDKLNLIYDKLFLDSIPIKYNLKLDENIFYEINKKYNKKKEIIENIKKLYQLKDFNKEINNKSNYYKKIENKFININNISEFISFLNKYKIKYNSNKIIFLELAKVKKPIIEINTNT